MKSAIAAGVQEWNKSSVVKAMETNRERRYEWYRNAWRLYNGDIFIALDTKAKGMGLKPGHRIYRETRLLWKHAKVAANFYRDNVYQGFLTEDGRPSENGMASAVPIEMAGMSKESEQQLRLALGEVWRRTNWQQVKSVRPLYAAIFGECLTEIDDDLQRHTAWAQTIEPEFVKWVVVDAARNVKAYALEYWTTDPDTGDSYKFGKEVTKESFSYFKNDQPFDAYGEGEVVVNPYGFVPAVWDVHQVGKASEPYGIGVYEDTMQPLAELNSLLSQAIDYQRKPFAMPIMLKGRRILQNGREITASPSPQSADFIDIGENGGAEQVPFDIGKTMELLEFMREGILNENPEATAYEKLRDMTTISGRAAAMLLGDISATLNHTRSGEDDNTRKIHQMQIAIMGYRLQSNHYESPDPRDEVFRPFNLDSFKAGALNFVIPARPLIPLTPDDRLDIARQTEQLETNWAREEVGLTSTEAQRIEREKRAAWDVQADAAPAKNDDQFPEDSAYSRTV